MPFLLVIVLAYVFGILYKLIRSRDGTVYLYMPNACIMLAGVALYIRNHHRETEQGIVVPYGQVTM